MDFDKLYNKFKLEILEKHADMQPLSDELASIFHKLSTAIDQLLAKIGLRIIAEPQDLQYSLEDGENIQSLSAIIKQKDAEIAALSKNLKESEENL